MAYCIDNVNLDGLNEMEKRQEREQIHWEIFAKEGPEEHGIPKKISICVWQERGEIKQIHCLFWTPPLNFNNSFKTLKRSLKLMM